MDGDGDLEIVISTERLTSAHQPYVATLDLTTGAIAWMSGPIPDTDLPNLRVAEVDGDPNPELIVSGSDPFGDLFVFSPDADSLDLEVIDQLISALDTPDLDGDGIAEIIVGTWRGEIWRLDPSTGEVLEEYYDLPNAIDALRFHDVPSYPGHEIAVTTHDELKILDLGGCQLAAYQFHSPHPSGELGLRDTLWSETIDGRSVLLANLGTSGFAVLRVDDPAAYLFSDDFESGDISAWSVVVPGSP
jgi:hypothetical protein